MAVKRSNYSGVVPTTVGTTLTASGTLIAAPGATSYIMPDFISYWLVDPAGSNTVTLAMGAVTLPPVGLSSSRTAFTHGPCILDANGALTVTLAGAGSVGFYYQYNIATD